MNQTTQLTIAAPKGLRQWAQIYRLYRSAFPVTERKPFSMIYKMYRTGKTDVWYCTKNKQFIGLAITINGAKHILLDYFAIVPGHRGEGLGSALLQALHRRYAGMGLFGEIESVYEDCPDRSLRLRRKQFYLDNGMTSMEVMVNLFGVTMELLGFDCRLTFEEYKAFYRDNYGQWAADHISPAPPADEWKVKP